MHVEIGQQHSLKNTVPLCTQLSETGMADRKEEEEEKAEVMAETDKQQDPLLDQPTRKDSDSTPSAFRKSAFLTVFVALLVYSYQVCIYRVLQSFWWF